MPEHHQKHDQQDSQNHDDCDDCKRQRAQNQKLIAIYQKLQQVDKKTTDVKSLMVIHKQNYFKNAQMMKSFDQKVEKIKNNKNCQQQSQFQQIGYNLYTEILQSYKKTQSEKQNDRLKTILKGIYKERQQRSKEKKKVQKTLLLPDISQSQSIQWFNQRDKTSRVESIRAESFHQTLMGKSFQISSTKSSFHLTKRKMFEKKDFEELNLWLFQQRNQILQKQLYQKGQKCNNPQKIYQSKKGIQKYINLSRDANKNQQQYLNASAKRGYPLIKSQRKSLNSNEETKKTHEAFKSRYEDASKAEHNLNTSSYNSGKTFTMKVRKGCALPAIRNK